ncbi:hypothetical protein SDC9_124588 [bioreactor metagenome]|uniref:Uncharacterized protein n=1 Tax=bioreactor metagenome TaxID=1076179 RepID=A0A645CLE6_9ZZZZ
MPVKRRVKHIYVVTAGEPKRFSIYTLQVKNFGKNVFIPAHMNSGINILPDGILLIFSTNCTLNNPSKLLIKFAKTIVNIFWHSNLMKSTVSLMVLRLSIQLTHAFLLSEQKQLYALFFQLRVFVFFHHQYISSY